jgi:hypothetical protein
MDRKQIAANACVASIGIIFIAVMLWFRPDKTLEMLVPVSTSLVLVVLVSRRTKFDERKDERTIQLMVLGARNAFFFLLFAMPMLATFSLTGIILNDAGVALMLLWVIMMAIAWISFLYYYTR